MAIKAKTTRRALLVSDEVIKASDAFREKTAAAVAADPALSAKVQAVAYEAELALKLEEVRKGCGLTQKELAVKMGTTQPAIARLERKGYLGNLRTIAQFAAACGKKLTISLE
jgi:HTH-type transcriptional regulator / antitoxin HipB